MSTTTTVSSIQPNLRFGTSFLDSSKYRDRAANGEALMDKRTGEVVLKRKNDGSFIYFDRENLRLDDYIGNIRAITRSNVRFQYPTEYNTTDVGNTFFETFLLDTQEFVPEIENGLYCDGIKFRNNLTLDNYVSEEDTDGNKILDQGFSISTKTNGIIVKLVSRPRDTSLIEYAAGIYNNYYKKYSGTDETILNEQEKLKDPTYEKSNVEIGISITGDKHFSTTAYLKLNEWSLILFKDVNGSPLDFSNDSDVRVIINYVRFPKIENVTNILSESEKDRYQKLLDSSSANESNPKERIAITHAYVSTFVQNDSYMQLPDYRNSKVLELIGLKPFTDSMRMIGNIASTEGVHISEIEPDEQQRLSVAMWAERIRDVYAKGETVDIPENTDHSSKIEDLEKLFGAAESIDGDITLDSKPNKNQYQWKQIKRFQAQVPYWLLGDKGV